MKTNVLVWIAGLLVIDLSVATGFETVWVKDVTETIQADKRGLGDHDLPDQLTFSVRRGLYDLTLHLVRNYDIDPNADVYVVHEIKNGQSFLARTNYIEKQAVAYYQDIENMAFMTVRCASRSNHKCDRVINGNLQIGDCDYDLRLVESDFVSGRMSEVPSLIGKRYVLRDHADVENKDIATTCATNIEAKLYARLLEKQNQLRSVDATLPRYTAGLQDKGTKEKTRQQRRDYYVKVAVLIDSGVWDLYAPTVHSADPLRKDDEIRRKIREAYSHIMNGVNLRYKTIDDPSISITIILQHFTFFQKEVQFWHKRAKVVTKNGKRYIEAHPYHGDIIQWVHTYGIKMVPVFDNAMLFTGYELYKGSIDDNGISGVSPIAGVCDEIEKVSLIQSSHYYRTMITATHELGHNLGAHHDGTADAKACNPHERFIMHHRVYRLNITTPYSRNEWLFSTCSVESFKKTLISKDCVKVHGFVYDRDEWMMFMNKEAGDVFTPSMQCYIMLGPHFVHFGAVDENICHRLQCKNLKTRKILQYHFYAARGTHCGKNMWCIEGLCVSKRFKIGTSNPLKRVSRGLNSRVRPPAMQLWKEHLDLNEHFNL